MNEKPNLTIKHIADELTLSAFDDPVWTRSEAVNIRTYWNGVTVPMERHFKAKILWSDSGIYAHFEAMRGEEIIVAEAPDLTRKSIGLWNRDVVEIFVAPDRDEPRRYFEFEAAPTGEWLDVALDSTSGTRVSDWDYESGMETAAKIEEGRIVIAMKIPWSAFGKKPEPGDVWLGNILRCVGKDPDRGYLAWSPTMTEQPNFHVPTRFGEFHFIK